MNWKKQTIEDLRYYTNRKLSLENMEDRIKSLRYQRESIKAVSNSTPVMGGGNMMEDRLINSFCEEERLKYNMLSVKILVAGLDKALESLDETQRKVLDKFYINPVKNYAEKLCSELGYELAQIYRIKDAALYRLTLSLYGIIDY